MEKIEFILENPVAIKKLDYHCGKSVVIYKVHGNSDYYGITSLGQRILIGRYNHKTHVLNVNTEHCHPRDSTLRACITNFLKPFI